MQLTSSWMVEEVLCSPLLHFSLYSVLFQSVCRCCSASPSIFGDYFLTFQSILLHFVSIYWLCQVSVLGWANFSKSSQIEPLFLYSMCMGKIRSHAKFQVSSFNILKWQPLFVNQSWHWESHLKWPESGTFDLAPYIGIKNALQNGITLGVFDFRKYVERLDGNW